MATKRKGIGRAEAGDQMAAEEAREERREAIGDNRRRNGKEVAAAHERLNRMEGVLETARGKVRAEWKKLKEEGFNTAALKRARKDLREDPLDAQMDFEDYLTYRNLLGMDDAVEAARQAEEREANATSVRAAETRGASTHEAIANAHDEGLIAGRAARNKETNPYEEGSPEALSWGAGWLAGQRQNMPKPAPVHDAAA